MARTIGMESLEQKIEKAKHDVVKSKQKYDAAVSKLSVLMDKREVLKKEQLVAAIMKSDKTFEEILRFVNSTTSVKV